MKLRVVVYNIHKGVGGLDRRYRPDRIAEVIRYYAPDLALLQEVDEGAARSDRHRQAHLLAQTLGMEYVAHFINRRARGVGGYGNAVLSRWPIEEATNIDVSAPLSTRRSVLHARVRCEAGGHARTLHVYNLHLGLSQILRKAQLRTFLASDPFARQHHASPMILAGDFNDVWGTLGGAMLAPAGFRGMHEPLRTFPAWAPLRALDAIYVRGDIDLVEVHRSRLDAARFASDHLPLVGELKLR